MPIPLSAAALPVTITPEPRAGSGQAQLARPDGLLTPLGGAAPLASAEISADFNGTLDGVRAQLAKPSGPLTPLGASFSRAAPFPQAKEGSAGSASAGEGISKTYLLGSRAGSHAPDVKGAENFWGKDGFSFGDLIDIVNPLQHIPVLSGLYRSLTGDEISPGARILGGGLLGGGLGLFASATGAVMKQQSGEEISDTMLASIGGNRRDSTQVALLTPEQAEAQIATLRTSSNPNRFRQIAALQNYQQTQVVADAKTDRTLAKA